MREHPEKLIFGSESPRLDPPEIAIQPPEIKAWQAVAKAVSWRVVGTIDTLILSWVLITYLGSIFGMEQHGSEALEPASYIAITEVATKMVFYFLHERFWVILAWGTLIEDGKRAISYARTTTKTAIWRVIASLDAMLLAWLFTRNIGTAISIGGLEVFTKLVLYFFHERIWAKLPFGIEHDPQPAT